MSVDIDRFVSGYRPEVDPSLLGDSVTYTDLTRCITYANRHFIDDSGYSLKELLGASHKIIRHPDVPAEIYRDLWATISQGQIWNGILKNRCKNGSIHWSRATITPFFDEKGQVAGYKAIRVKPLSAEIKQAQETYKLLKNRSSGASMQAGELVVKGPRDWIRRLRRVDLKFYYAAAIFGVVLGGGLLAQQLPFWWGVLTLVGLASLTSWVVYRYVIEPLQRIIDSLNRVSSGDLAVQFKERHTGLVGHLEHALDLVTVNLRTVVKDIKGRTLVLGSISQKIIESNANLARRTESTTVSLRQTTESMHVIGHTAIHSSEAAQKSVEQSRHSIEVANRGHAAVDAINSAMTQIVESSRRIGKITKLIESVAFQTNILALNASIEAAQAGPMGRGFAVVANEVRALAQSTTKAANDIKRHVEESSQRVATGHELSIDAGITIEEVIKAVEGIAQVLTTIDASAREQQQGIFMMGDALDGVGAITEENAMMVYEFAELGEVLETHSEDLIKSMQIFRL